MSPSAASPSSWPAHDAHVVRAWTMRRLTDGTGLDFDARREQTFRIAPDRTTFVPPKETGTMFCPGRDVSDYAKVDYAKIAPHAGGHAHLNRASSLPGPEDGSMAVLTGKPAYVISETRVFAIERGDAGFTVRKLGGRNFDRSERTEMARRIASWNLHNGGSGVPCRLVPDA